MRLQRTAATACLLAFLILDAFAQDRAALEASDLPVVMNAYVEAAVDLRNAYEGCAPENLRPANWEAGATLLTESLRGAGLAETVLSAISTRMSAPALPAETDCSGEQFMLYSGIPVGGNWPGYHRSMLETAGIEVVEAGVEDGRLAAVREVVAAALPQQRRMLECLSLFDPRTFVSAYGDWNQLVDRADQALAAAGYGPGVYRPITDAARSGAIFVPPADRGATAQACTADQGWMNRYATFAWYTFASDVEAALTGGQP